MENDIRLNNFCNLKFIEIGKIVGERCFEIYEYIYEISYKREKGVGGENFLWKFSPSLGYW